MKREGAAKAPIEAFAMERDQFFALSLDMLCVAGLDGYFKLVSPGFTETLGWASDELLARPFEEFVHPDDRAAMRVELEKLGRGVPTIKFENQLRSRDGSFRWVAWKAQPAAEEGLFYATARDVTQRRQTEEALRSSEARYRTLFSSIDQGFCLIEVMFDGSGKPVDYRFLEINQSFERLTGMIDAVGKRMREIAPNHEEHWFDTYGRVAVTGESIRFQNRADALHRWYDVFAFRVGKPEQRHVGILFDDITRRKQVEDEIAQLNVDLRAGAEHLDQANRELESFSYSVSHDLRAPLRHIHGYVDLLQKATTGQLSETSQRYLATIKAASLEMGQLIDDLLAFSRMARTELQQSLVDLNALVEDVIRVSGASAGDRNIVWHVAPLPSVVGDQSLLKQVLTNLVDNAVKYSRRRDPARIEIGRTGEEDGRVVLFVRDNGAGFDMQHASKLFGVFQRLHRADEFEGTGIGLATVQRVVARHGGRVWAESAADQGATFYFTLKTSPPA